MCRLRFVATLNCAFTSLVYKRSGQSVFFYQDKASCHKAYLTSEYLVKINAELGICGLLIPTISPLDLMFGGFGYLKQRLSSRRAKTMDGIWKLYFLEVWSKIDIIQI